MRIIQWILNLLSLKYGQFYPHNFHIWWFLLYSFNRIQVLWCYCHNTIKKFRIRPSMGEIWAKIEVKKAPWFRKTPNFYSIILNISSPESQTTLSVILSVSTPPIKYKNVYRNFQNYPHSLPYWIKKRARAQSPTFFYLTFWKLSEGNSFILHIHSYELLLVVPCL